MVRNGIEIFNPISTRERTSEGRAERKKRCWGQSSLYQPGWLLGPRALGHQAQQSGLVCEVDWSWPVPRETNCHVDKEFSGTTRAGHWAPGVTCHDIAAGCTMQQTLPLYFNAARKGNGKKQGHRTGLAAPCNTRYRLLQRGAQF